MFNLGLWLTTQYGYSTKYFNPINAHGTNRLKTTGAPTQLAQLQKDVNVHKKKKML